MSNFPTMDALSTNIITAGFSSGSYMSAQLMVAFPETFKCGGFLNGGMPSQTHRKDEYTDDSITDDEHFAETQRLIQVMEDAGTIGDQSNLSDAFVYVYGGEKDESVGPIGPQEQKRYFESVGATVSFTMDPDQIHWFPTGTAAGLISDYCYSNNSVTGADNDYTNNQDFLESGAFRRFDQWAFADEQSDITNDRTVLGLQQYGYYYIPTDCQTKACQMQLILHGCGDSAQVNAQYYASYAAANNVVMLFPQAVICFDSFPTDPPRENQLTANGDQMKWMKALIDQATSPRTDQFTTILANGEYTFEASEKGGEYYGEDKGSWYQDENGNWVEGESDGKSDGKSSDKGDWYQDENGKWVEGKADDTDDSAMKLAVSLFAAIGVLMNIM